MMAKSTIFEGKTVLITGGSNGIGLALAEILAQNGATVWLLARRVQYLEESMKKLVNTGIETSQRHGYVVCDVSNENQVTSSMKKVITEIGIPDILINCAGVVHPGEFLDLELPKFHWMMDVNYFGIIYVLKELLPGMIERGSGHIVNISSMAGVIGIYGYAAYSPSKSAVISLSQALHAELKPKGIFVSVALPTDTDTDQLRYENEFRPAETSFIASLGSVQPAASVADQIIKGVSRKKFLILPSFDAKLFYWAEKILGNNLLYIFDLLIWWTRKYHKG